MSNLWIRVAFSSLLGLVVALTVGTGVMMVVTPPRAPDTPSLTFRQIQNGSDNQQDADKIIGVVDRFYQDAYDFRRGYPTYERNILVVTVLLALVVGAAGIALGSTFNYLRLGLTIGAILLVLFGANAALSPVPNPAPIGSGSVTGLLAAGSPPGLDFAGRFLRFAVSFVTLLVFLFLGLWRLTDWAPARSPAGTAATPAAGPASSAIGTEASPGEHVAWGRPDGD